MSEPVRSILTQLSPPFERDEGDGWGPPWKVAVWRGDSPVPAITKYDRGSEAFSAAVQALLKMTLREEPAP